MWIKQWSVCFSINICLIHYTDHLKTFTLLLKSEMINFETFSQVHVYCIGNVCIEYVLYWLLTISSQPCLVAFCIVQWSDMHFFIPTEILSLVQMFKTHSLRIDIKSLIALMEWLCTHVDGKMPYTDDILHRCSLRVNYFSTIVLRAI